MSPKSHHWLVRSSLVSAIIVGAVGVGAARIVFNGGQLALEGSGPVDPQQGVYVRDSAIAADKFELGKRMERLKEWPKSADVYQEILEKYQDRVVPTVTNDKGQAIKYASVTVAVQERLARWPEEGLTVYKTRFEPAAATLLEQARRDDLAALHRIFSLYFATDSAKTAGMRLIDLYLEQGEFSAAAWIGDRLLDWHPGISAERAGILFRTATAYHLAGNEAMAKKRAEDLHTNFPNDIGTIAGRDMKFAEAIDQQLASQAPIAAGGGGDSYRMINGDVARAAVSTAVAKPGARVWTTPLPGPPLTGQTEQMKQAFVSQYEQARNNGATTGVIPVVDRGEIFFQDGYRVYALHVESGVPLAGWNQTYSGSRNGQYWLPGQNMTNLVMGVGDQWTSQMIMAPRQYTLTLTDDSVLGVMGQPDMRALLGQVAADGGTRMVCLERSTGKPRWIANPNDLPNNPGNARNLSFSGSPMVVGDQVYVIARGSSGAGVEDCHMFCYDLPSGKYRWNCYVASSQVAGMALGQPALLSNDTMSHPAFASGRVFINTNLGAVAAIDAYSGATAWLTIYPRDESNAIMRQRGGMGGFGWGGAMPLAPSGDQSKPWEFNPVIVQDGKVFVLPNDGRHVLIYDAATGEEVKRINREIEFNNDTVKLTMLLGVMGDRLIVGGPRSGASYAKVFCLNWRSYTPNKNDERRLDVASTMWFEPFDSIRGRPFITKDALFVSSEKALYIINIITGRVVQRFPRDAGEWPESEGPGNLVITGDHVIVAGARGVNVYTDLASVRQKYETAIANDPNNVEARLVFSELMFNARELKETRKALDDAIEILGGAANMRPGPLRDRAFSDSLMFAQKLGAENSSPSIALAEELFDRAGAAASNPSQRVNYRLSRARFIEGLKAVQTRPDYPKAVKLYQEILSDPEMRIITLAGEDASGTLQAGKLAENAINDLVRKVDKSIYDELEKEAAGKLAALGKQGNPDELMALAENYPNSKVASDALMLAARRYEDTDKPRMATQVLRRLNWKYNFRFTGAERGNLIEAMARNYLKVGNLGAALGRLNKGNSILPDEKLDGELTLPDGKKLARADGKPVTTIGEAADALQEIVQKSAAAAPVADAKIPLPPTMEDRLARKPIPKPFAENPVVYGGVQAILESPVELIERMRTDRIVTWANRKIACFNPGGKEPRWISDAIGDNAMGIAWLDATLMAWGESEVALIEGETGKTTWRVDVRGLPAVDLVIAGGSGDGPTPNPAGGSGGQQQAGIAQQDALVQAEMARMQFRRRRGLVEMPPPEALVPGGAAGIAAANNNAAAADGKERVLHVRPLTDRVIVSTTTGRILALNLENGRVIWQTRLASGRQIQQTLATDDFTAARLMEGANVQLVVLDTYNGQQIWRKNFVTSQQNYPMNCVLSPSGMLVWTTPQTMAAMDLYEPSDRPSWENRGRTYAGMLQPDQLIVSGTEVFAVSDSGKFVDRRSLASGQKHGEAIGTGSPTGVMDTSVRLRLSGSRLYVVGAKSVLGYHLEADSAYGGNVDRDVNSQSDDVMITRDYLVVPGQVTGAGKEGTYVLRAYSRLLLVSQGTDKISESGLLAYHKEFSEPGKITSWAAVDGGVYYLTGDDRLVFLKGTQK